jgi:hypothetical protein
MLEYTHTLADGKGSMPMASLWSGKLKKMLPGTHTVAVISGGYMDVTKFQTVLEYSLGLCGANCTLKVELPDNSQSLSQVNHFLQKNSHFTDFRSSRSQQHQCERRHF